METIVHSMLQRRTDVIKSLWHFQTDVQNNPDDVLY